MNKRRTTSYLLEVPTFSDPNPVADKLIAAFPGEVEASGVGRNRAFIRFRAVTDEEAMVAVHSLPSGEHWRLSRGYGIHHEIVATGDSD